MPEELSIIEICRYMGGWTYQDYMNQPTEFIDIIITKISEESIYQRGKTNQLRQR